MNNIARKTITFVATSAIIVNAFAPLAFADTTLTITGNGASSQNGVNVTNTNTTTVTQNNSANVTNDVTSTSNTGGNQASDNTGGNTGISTGNAISKANVSTAVNLNQAVVPGCNCGSLNKVVIAGNGANSNNQAGLENTNTTEVFQNNRAEVTNNVDTIAATGKNNANYNTGGTTGIGTGNATSVANVTTQANANIAQVGGTGNGSGGSTVLKVLDNGAQSNNNVWFDNNNATTLEQGNNATVINDVKSKAFTGKNDANYNTGGSTGIGTGDAYATATVDTMANFNAANVGCGCDSTVTANVNGNGYDAYDNLSADLSNSTSVFQGGEGNGNQFVVNNPVDSKAKTGSNGTNYNTGTSTVTDPVLNFTGNAWSDSTVGTNGNVNIFGSIPTFTMPSFDLGGGNSNNLNFSFDFNFLGQQS